MRRFFRFSIRDLLWLTLVVATALGWFVHQERLRVEATLARQEAASVNERAQVWFANAKWYKNIIDSIDREDQDREERERQARTK